MRHRKKGKKLGRNTKQRKALFKNLIQALIFHEQIKTTESKAKAVKRLMDKLITKAKVGSLHARRQILAFLPSKKAANKLVDEIAPRFKKRSSGFTRFFRIGRRKGDNTSMVQIELIEKKEIKDDKSDKKNRKDKKSASKQKNSKTKK
jgi:large subunit ribosomal protein L17